MPRTKRFKATPPVTENSSDNLDEARSMPLTHSRAHSIAPTRSGASFVPPSDGSAHFLPPTHSIAQSVPLTHSRPHSVPPTHSGARFVPPTHSGAGFVPPTHSGAHSRPSTHIGAHSRPHSYGSAHSGPSSDTCFMPSSHSYEPEPELEPEYTSSFDESEDDLIPTSDDAGTIKEGRLKVQDIWSPPAGKKVIITCNELGQPIDDSGGLLGSFLGDLGSDYSKFPICYVSWRKVPGTYKEKVYDDIIQKKFHIKDSRLKGYIMKNIGKKWKDTRHNLFHQFYDQTLTIEENVARRPSGINPDHWTWFIEYRKDRKTQEICKKNAKNRKKQLYTHTGGSKSIPRRKAEEERQHGSRTGRGEMWTIVHKRKDGSYVNDEAKIVGEKIMDIERQDGSSQQISQDDSLARVLGKEHSGRVRGVGFGPSVTQIFGHTTHQFSRISSTPPIQTKVDEMKLELELEKLKVQKLESVVKTERLRRQSFEGVITRFLLQQGKDLPPELAAIVDIMICISNFMISL